MRLVLDKPITARQALLLLVSRQLETTQRVDPVKIHYCLNLIVIAARNNYRQTLREISLPKPSKFPGINDTLSVKEWNQVINEKLDERLMTTEPAEYGLTPEGREVAKLVEHGEIKNPDLFEPDVSHMMGGDAHQFFVTRAKRYAKTPTHHLEDLINLAAVA